MANLKFKTTKLALSMVLLVPLFTFKLAYGEEAVCYDCLAEELDFHGVVLAGDREGITFQKSYGRADVPGRAPALSTRYNMGSMMKMMTAVAVAQLVERGEVDFEQAIRTYMPDLPESYQPITVHHLLSHTSGLGNYLTPENMPTLAKHNSIDDLMLVITKEGPEFTPGERFSYSNSGFVVLGALIEALSNQSYEGFLTENIFKVAGMTQTGLGSDEKTAVNYTRMFGNPGQRRMQRQGQPSTDQPHPPLKPSPMNGVRGMPAGGTYSTAEDLYLFAKALLDGKLVGKETLEIMTTPKPKAVLRTQSGGEQAYGYGFIIAEGGARFGHGGGGPGVNAELRIWPETGQIVVGMTNIDPPLASQMVSNVGKALNQ